jgi:uncharacterized membrane protein YdfJ with MMPL/SSD domain
VPTLLLFPRLPTPTICRQLHRLRPLGSRNAPPVGAGWPNRSGSDRAKRVGTRTATFPSLLTGIRERYPATLDATVAVAEGLALSARTITAAALVIVPAFASFALAGATSIKEIGAGLAVAIAIDATVVRLVLVPAAMRLLGDWN